jgi:uncharacterized NAD(P)/FAD-binding protein YdhS
MMRIAIIGAGLSGRLLALNLLQQASTEVSITIIDRSQANAMGPAYSSQADHLLLNVPACRMGALAGDPEHFLKWVQNKGIPAGPWDFLPRRLYRDYVLELLDNALQEKTDRVSYEHICAEVTSLELIQDGAILHMNGATSISADKVVLALGNFPPRHPFISDRKVLRSPRYVRDPWDTGFLDSLSPADAVFVIGTGQTTVDLVVSLYELGHKGRILALSRRGFLPLVHTGFDPYPSFYQEIEGSQSVLEIFRNVRQHLKRAEAMGIDSRAVIDSLRPDTQALWSGLPLAEKRRFLRHLFRHWEIIRSRIPAESQVIIEKMRDSGQLEIVAGRIHNLVEKPDTMQVHYLPLGGTDPSIVSASLVINCIGPESNYARVDHPLVKNLLNQGLIRPGPARLGLDALPDGTIISRDGAASQILYTLGSPMKGVLWEVIAVPDIREQAKHIAQLLLMSGSDR